MTVVARRRRQKDVLLSELPDGTGVVVHLDKRSYSPLSSTGVLLWHLYDSGPLEDAALVACLLQRFGIDEGRAHNDVAAFVRALVAEGMLVDC